MYCTILLTYQATEKLSTTPSATIKSDDHVYNVSIDQDDGAFPKVEEKKVRLQQKKELKETTYRLKDIQSNILQVNVYIDEATKECVDVEKEIQELTNKDLERIFNVCCFSIFIF